MIFGDVGGGELLLLAIVALFVFGPDRLPRVAKDLGRALRQVRGMATTVRNDIRDEVGPEIADLDLSALNPKTFVTKHLFGDEEDTVSLDKGGGAAGKGGAPVQSRVPASRGPADRSGSARSGSAGTSGSARSGSPRPQQGLTPYDSDAT